MADEPISVELLKSHEMAERLRIDIKTLHALRKPGQILEDKVIYLTPKILRWDPVAVLKAISPNTKPGDVRAARPHPDQGDNASRAGQGTAGREKQARRGS